MGKNRQNRSISNLSCIQNRGFLYMISQSCIQNSTFLYMTPLSCIRFHDFLYMIYALPLKNSLALRMLVNKQIIRMLGKSW
jgi:hypothetical protein